MDAKDILMADNCAHCSRDLNISITKKVDQEEYKSCPKCSRTHHKQHIYFQSPEYFGKTPARETENNPEGVQSYCDACRPPSEKNNPSRVYMNGITCDQFD